MEIGVVGVGGGTRMLCASARFRADTTKIRARSLALSRITSLACVLDHDMTDTLTQQRLSIASEESVVISLGIGHHRPTMNIMPMTADNLSSAWTLEYVA